MEKFDDFAGQMKDHSRTIVVFDKLLMGTRGRKDSLSSALFGKTRQAVLALLYGRPDEAFYLRQVARAVGAGQGAVQRELKRLAEAGLITRSSRGRQVYYQADQGCPIFAEIRGLMVKTAGLADAVRRALSPLAAEIRVAFIYGSQATGKATAGSDVDLLVVGDVDEMRIHRAVAKAEKHLGRAVNCSLLSREEFARRRRKKGGIPAGRTRPWLPWERTRRRANARPRARAGSGGRLRPSPATWTRRRL